MSAAKLRPSVSPIAFILLIIAMLGATLAPAQTTVYVSSTGDDTAAGTLLAPYETLQRALQDTPEFIRVESGQYLLTEQVTIPSGVTVIGGHKAAQFPDGTFRWEQDIVPTTFLALSQPPDAAIIVEDGGTLSWCEVAGGFYSVELRAGGRVFETEFLGAEFAAIYSGTGTNSNPAVIDRCRILGGSSGIRIAGTASVAIIETVAKDTLGKGAYVTGSGVVGFQNCVFQNNNGDGVSIYQNSNAFLSNCVVRRNSGDGIVVSRAASRITGSLIALNGNGITLIDANDAKIQNCTIANNRGAGIYTQRSQPDLVANIIVDNKNHGVFEDKPDPIIDVDEDGTTYTITFPTEVAQLEQNVFWSNEPFQYFDEGESSFDNEDDINFLLVNTINPIGNRVLDPLFKDTAKQNYRLSKDSPAVDMVGIISGQVADLDGNSRNVDVPGFGNEATQTVDAGAYETQNSLIRNFGTEYYDQSLQPGVIDPSENTLVRRNPEWEFQEFQGFNEAVMDFLPGGIRLYSEQDGTFGELFRYILDQNQPAEKIQYIRATVQASAFVGQQFTRFRINGPEGQDVAATFSYLGTRELAPSLLGTEYELITDLRQGGYRSIPFVERDTYQAAFRVDIIDFQNLTVRMPQDLTKLQVDFVDRDEFDAQFTRELKRYTFESAVGNGWEPFYIPGGLFTNPRLRYNSALDALELTQTSANCFGLWQSEQIDMPAGVLYRVDFRVSTPNIVEQTPWFRFRSGTGNFELSQELLIQPFPLGDAGPDADGEWYSLYGRMPEVLGEVYEPDSVPLVLYMDMFGFDATRTNGTIYMEEVVVWTTQD